MDGHACLEQGSTPFRSMEACAHSELMHISRALGTMVPGCIVDHYAAS